MPNDDEIIASIKADIAKASARIEFELGAHPAFTWAQTRLRHAIANLEAKVAGEWTEPTFHASTDERGFPIAPTSL